MASVNIHCPRCQLTYTYQARKPGMKELITEMAFNGAGGAILPGH